MDPMFTTPEVRARVEARIREVQTMISNKYPQYLARWPTIIYKTKSATGGWAHLGRNTVDYNPILLNENLDAFIARTVGHEVAHLAAYELFRDKGHGYWWKHIMRVIGQEPSRCHSYDIVNSAVKTKRSIIWRCTGCGHQGLCMKKMADRILSGVGAASHKCRRGVSSPVEILGSKHIQEVRATALLKVANKSAPVTAPTKAPKKGTRLAFCQMLKTNHPEYGREQLIKAFVDLGGMTKAGATTYYYKLK